MHEWGKMFWKLVLIDWGKNEEHKSNKVLSREEESISRCQGRLGSVKEDFYLKVDTNCPFACIRTYPDSIKPQRWPYVQNEWISEIPNNPKKQLHMANLIRVFG